MQVNRLHQPHLRILLLDILQQTSKWSVNGEVHRGHPLAGEVNGHLRLVILIVNPRD